jgi:hypothetical protein
MFDRTVLVLGAGASLSYGLPLGTGLLQNIKSWLPSDDRCQMGDEALNLSQHLQQDMALIDQWVADTKRNPHDALIEFRQRLSESRPKSIDEFLSRDFSTATKIFRQIGKLAIAHAIAASESPQAFEDADGNLSNDHWYNYLWQECLAPNCKTLEDLKNKKLRVISFNYDRSLEYFLGKKIAATHLAKPGNQLNPKFVQSWARDGFLAVDSNLKITHPYGTLGPLNEIPYGALINGQLPLGNMARRIRVIGEERADPSDTFADARSWIASADRVVFLGFSFDPLNMERLGLKDGLEAKIQAPEKFGTKSLFPLTYGLERAERKALYDQYFNQHFQTPPHWEHNYADDRWPISETHHNISITQYLRRYGALTKL